MFKCNLCNKVLSSKDNLTRHTNIHNIARFICDICPLTYTRQDNLYRHVKNKHGTYFFINIFIE